ncbi:hypothetical protein [Gimesia maris]|uniref:hypothetical protein n=1 Tax=Gimesia maris TaxID=122 RepID=UPI0030DD5F5E|tara:strand:+ start:173586 stop:173834 length:249 start_codon:yes stop_codon:yes gene_type:complete
MLEISLSGTTYALIFISIYLLKKSSMGMGMGIRMGLTAMCMRSMLMRTKVSRRLLKWNLLLIMIPLPSILIVLTCPVVRGLR